MSCLLAPLQGADYLSSANRWYRFAQPPANVCDPFGVDQTEALLYVDQNVSLDDEFGQVTIVLRLRGLHLRFVGESHSAALDCPE